VTTPGWRGLLRSPLSGSIRARVVALGLIAVIPAVGMAGIIAGQDYRGRERVAIEHVDRLQGLAIARIDALVARLYRSMNVVADHLPAPSPACGEMLRVQFARRTLDPPDLALFDADGSLVCASGVPSGLRRSNPGQASWFRAAQASQAPGLALIDGLAAAVIGRHGDVLAALLPQGWFAPVGRPDVEANQAAVWLFDKAGNIIASNGLTAAALPALPTLVTLQRSRDGSLLAESAGGVPYAYAATRLPNGWQVVGAYGATKEHLSAQRVLFTRLAYLAALLLLGLGVTVLGVDIAFGGPLRRLRHSLTVWQGGGAFDTSGLASAPTELLDLAQSFNRAAISLREQRDALERGKAQQDLLIMEIHHRVKNNLQIVASLLNLQASRIRVPEARAEFQAARDRVRALATLHRHLYSEGEIHTINMPSFLDELCGQLFQAMGEEPGGRIKLIIEAEEIRLSTDQAVPLALIVTEAVTNAIKYGFPGGLSGTVTIKLAQCADALDLSIGDDGVGIPPGPSETETGTRDGLGLQLIRGFSRQLGATLAVTEGAGTQYRIHMPLRSPLDRDEDSGIGDPA
jgi:two-component sensor histidine kinase